MYHCQLIVRVPKNDAIESMTIVVEFVFGFVLEFEPLIDVLDMVVLVMAGSLENVDQQMVVLMPMMTNDDLMYLDHAMDLFDLPYVDHLID